MPRYPPPGRFASPRTTFATRDHHRLVAWLVALPQVTDWRQFPELNVFRRELTAVGYRLLSLSFAGAAL